MLPIAQAPLERILNALINLLVQIIDAIPSIIAALIIILIGYFVGSGAGKAINKLIEVTGIEKGFDQTEAGRAFRRAGLDLSNFMEALVKAFIIVISISIALQYLNISGPAGQFIIDVAAYLPRLIGGIILLSLGFILAEFLAGFVGRILRGALPEEKSEIADMIKNLLLIGLVALILSIALEMMVLTGQFVYTLILGFLIIGAGIVISDTLIRSIVEDHPEFRDVAGYAKFILYSMFAIVGVAGIFATFPGVSAVIANLAWAFAIAFALMLIPVAYTLAKRMAAAK